MRRRTSIASRTTRARSVAALGVSLTRQNLLRVQTGIWLQAMQQLTGINFICALPLHALPDLAVYYGTTFFQQVCPSIRCDRADPLSPASRTRSSSPLRRMVRLRSRCIALTPAQS